MRGKEAMKLKPGDLIAHDTATAIVKATMLDPRRRGHTEMVRVYVLAAKIAETGDQGEWHDWEELQRLGWAVVPNDTFMKILLDVTEATV